MYIVSFNPFSTPYLPTYAYAHVSSIYIYIYIYMYVCFTYKINKPNFSKPNSKVCLRNRTFILHHTYHILLFYILYYVASVGGRNIRMILLTNPLIIRSRLFNPILTS